MKFLIIPIAVLVINQIIKFFLLLIRQKNINGSRLSWSVFWVGQFPSAHTAVLISLVFLIWSEYGLNSIFAFSLFTALIVMYGLLEDKKRQILYEEYFVKSSDPVLQKIVKDKIIMDFSGHVLKDLLFGVLEGVVFTGLFLKYFNIS